MRVIIKAGDKYGKLTAVEFVHKGKYGNQYWMFRCDCGIKKVIIATRVKNGYSKTCGCSHGDNSYKHGMTNTPTYISWQSMKNRCLNPNAPDHKHYGGRGIKVCKRWINSFQNFYKDMGVRPKNRTLDRKENDGNYCKSNCRWATPKQQRHNRRDTIKL